jgi:O-antigen ligase
VIKRIIDVLNKSNYTQILLGLFIIASFLPFRHVLNYSSASRFGWYAEPLAISIYLADIIFLILVAINWNKRPIAITTKTVILFASIVFLMAEAFRNPDFSLATYSLFRVIQFGILIYAFTRFAERLKIRVALSLILAFIGIFQSLLGIYQVSAGHSLGLRYLGEQTISVSSNGVAKIDLGNGERLMRAYGTMSHPNILGGFMILSICASIWLFLTFPVHRNKIFLIFLLLIIGLLLTFSRSAFLSLFFVFVMSAWHFRPHFSISLFLKFLLALSVALTLFVLISPINTAIWHRIIPTSADMFISDRIILASNGAKLFFEHPTIGVGLGNYFFDLVKIAPVGSGLQNWQYDYPHNAIAELLAELGICGVIMIFYIISILLPKHFFTLQSFIIFLIIISPLILLDHYLWTNQTGRIILIMFLALLPSIFGSQNNSRA